VSAAPESAANAAIVKSTIELGHNLGLDVVAEGVETEACLKLIAAMECDLVQGYIYSPPMPAGEVLAWVAADLAAAHDAIAYDTEGIKAAC
jgi:EAL domain-containing protein (putative c-di-GMP-specific phosphodiesterase class I)